MDGALEPQGDLLDCQQSWTSSFFGPGIAFIVCFLLEGLSHPSQDWALARDQQEAEEGEEGSLGA